MKIASLLTPSIIVFLILSGCVRSDMANLSAREEYFICFSSPDEAPRFKEYVISIARQEGLTILDRSSEAENELRSLDYGNVVLDNTVGPLILMTVERRNVLRISITNAGLGNDLNLTFRYVPGPRPIEATTVLQSANREYRVITIGSDGATAHMCDAP